MDGALQGLLQYSHSCTFGRQILAGYSGTTKLNTFNLRTYVPLCKLTDKSPSDSALND